MACGAGAPSLPSLIEQVRTALLTSAAPVLSGDQDFGPLGTPPSRALVPAAVLVPIVRTPEPRLLLTTRTAHLRSHAGQVAFPHLFAQGLREQPRAGLCRMCVMVIPLMLMVQTMCLYHGSQVLFAAA